MTDMEKNAAERAKESTAAEAQECRMKNAAFLDVIRGSLVGGAAGDALGYPVEFYSLSEIQNLYGESGITHYHYGKGGLALISDDTQMTLFTATGLQLGTMLGERRDALTTYPDYVRLSYGTWYQMQTGHPGFGFEAGEKHPYSWLYRVPEMGESRAPGNTCMSALSSGKRGTIEHPLNHSKGCGGIMRVAPVGLYWNRGDGEKADEIRDLDLTAAQIAAITHGHPLGYMPAAALAHIVNRVACWGMSIEQAVKDAVSAMKDLFAGAECLDEMLALMEKALLLARNDLPDTENIRVLGEGWVAEETLAISIYCSVKYANDFSKAIIAAVNHSGDSDSTGAVTGNIVGAALGFEAIPDEWKDHLECLDVILKAAGALL